MLIGTLFVLVVWVTVWQLIRARDRRLDADSRLAARRRVRAVAKSRDEHRDPPERD